MQYKLTIFTPTYNRAHTLPRLYKSLLCQGDATLFEWLIIDDYSTDNTAELVNAWICEGIINIKYIRLKRNGGKPRAINLAVKEARSPYLFILDSDDYLTREIVPEILKEINQIDACCNINGIGVLQSHSDGRCFAKPQFKDYIDATNLERAAIGLDVDCNEVYKIEILKKYPFIVWPGENFTPESTVLNAMAYDGYKIRWLNKIGVISEYQEDGLTKGSWNLQKHNPMGYAMLFNSNLLYAPGFKRRVYEAILFGTQCILGGNIKYILHSNALMLSLFTLPISYILYLRRLWQYR